MFDIAIIGAGPAGLSAAIHAKRFDLNCVVLERDTVGGQARAANWITNYPGFPGGITGHDLMGLFAKQAEDAGVRIKKCEASKIYWEDNCYRIDIVGAGLCPRPVEGGHGGPPLRSKNIILATGLEPIRLPFPFGERAACPPTVWWRGGEGVFYYPDPNSISHEGKNILIIGGGDSAFDEALSFSKKAAHVIIAMRSGRPKTWNGLIRQAKEAGIEIKADLSEECIAKLKADIIVACCGKRKNLDILDMSLRTANHESRTTSLQLAGDIAHPNIRHIAAAVGDGVRAVEGISRDRSTT